MHIARYYRKKPIRIKGVIVSDVEKRKAVNGSKKTFTLDVRKVKADWGWQQIKGKVLVNAFNRPEAAYGDYVMLEGKLHRPYNFSAEKNFSYRDYLSRRGIYFILSIKKSAEARILDRNRGYAFKALSFKVRNKLKSILTGNLSPNEAGIMSAILLGDRSGISKPIRTLFVQTGTAHILAISGLHIGIVAALFLVFIKTIPVGRRGQLGTVIVLLTAYAFLTGGRPSVVRAAIMMVTFLMSLLIEKEFDAFNALCLAAVIILVINPLNLFDVGFQLSFVCVLSIIYLNLVVKKDNRNGLLRKGAGSGRFIQNRWSYYIFQSFYLSLSIWIGVTGLIAYYFGIITPVTIFANLIVVPLVSVVVALGFGLLAVGILLPSCASIFAACIKVALNVMVGLIYLCDKIPFAYIYIKEVNMGHVTAYYSALFLMIFTPWRQLGGRLKTRYPGILGK